jgi:hypothetical protein
MRLVVARLLEPSTSDPDSPSHPTVYAMAECAKRSPPTGG